MSKRKKSVPLAELTLHEQEIVRQLRESLFSSTQALSKAMNIRINVLEEDQRKRFVLYNRLGYFNLFEALKLMFPGITVKIEDKNGNVRDSFSELTEEEALNFQPSVNFDDDIYPIQLPKHEQTPKNN